MTEGPLSGICIAILVESKFIPEEIEAYCTVFGKLGAEVHLISRLWEQEQLTFYSDVDPLGSDPFARPLVLKVDKDLPTFATLKSTYAALIMSANFTSVRLRSDTLDVECAAEVDARAFVQSPPAVKLFAAAMRDNGIVKGALCHGLWILTPFPDLLKGCKVTCNTVVMADILNCGAVLQFEEDAGMARPMRLAIDPDRNLVTGFSKDEAADLAAAVADRIVAKRSRSQLASDEETGL